MAAGCHRSGGLALAILIAAASLAETASGREPQALPGPATGLIVGLTVDGVAGGVIGGAIVSLSRAAPPPGAVIVATRDARPTGATRTDDPAPVNPGPWRVVSDSNGRFMFRELAAGSYTISASKPGYSDAAFGRLSSTDLGHPLALRDGERRGGVTLGLWKRATVGGTVLDEAGEPVIGIQVRVMRRAVVGGAVRFTQFGNQPTTDDRGVYRVSELVPGDYIVGVVTTQTTVPDSLQEAYAAASKNGAQQDFQREWDRSRGAAGSSFGAFAPGQRVGSWLLQAPLDLGSVGEIAAPPIAAGKVFVYPTVFHPSAASPSMAAVVSLGPGDERSTIDLHLRPVVTSRVSGELMGPNGPEAHTALNLVPAFADVLQRDYDAVTASTTTDATGAFVFLGVPPGSYTLRALKIPARPITPSRMTTLIQTGTTTISSGGGPSPPLPIPNEPTYWASTSVTVGESDVTGLAVVLRTGARLSGRVEFDGVADRPAVDRLTQLVVQLDNADARTTSFQQFTLGRGVVDASGNFTTYQLPAGRYVVRGQALPLWTFRGAFLNGRDVSDTPLELGAEDIGDIVLRYGDRPAELAGTARGASGPDGAATILVFPAQPGMWSNQGPAPRRFKAVRAGEDGAFRATNLPAGDYVVVGVHGAVPSEWQDPVFLRKLVALGTRTTVADGEIKSLDVSTKEVK